MKIVNDLLSVHKFVVISVVSIEIIVIVISFDSILKSSSILTRIQYIIDFSLVFVVYLSLLNLRVRSFDQARDRRRQSEADQNEIHHEHA